MYVYLFIYIYLVYIIYSFAPHPKRIKIVRIATLETATCASASVCTANSGLSCWFLAHTRLKQKDWAALVQTGQEGQRFKGQVSPKMLVQKCAKTCHQQCPLFGRGRSRAGNYESANPRPVGPSSVSIEFGKAFDPRIRQSSIWPNVLANGLHWYRMILDCMMIACLCYMLQCIILYQSYVHLFVRHVTCFNIAFVQETRVISHTYNIKICIYA